MVSRLRWRPGADAKEHLRYALQLALRGQGTASPNPMVGAVVVRSGRRMGSGFHRRPGEPHAEVRALRRAGSAARGATLFLNLEPCAHEGRTPPCVDAILRSGIRRVVCSMRDPNPRVLGRGLRALRRGGVEVHCGTLAHEARVLNEAYVHYVETGRPFVLLKAGMSLDGRIASAAGISRWITSSSSRQAAHDLRWAYDAILVGIGTILADDPELAARQGSRERADFLRVVLDTHLRTPPASRLAQAAEKRPTLILTGPAVSRRKMATLERLGVEIKSLARTRAGVSLSGVLRELGRRNVTSILVEGGSQIHASFLEAGRADKMLLFVAPMILGGKGAVPVVGGQGAKRPSDAIRLDRLTIGRQGRDLVLTGYPEQAGRKRKR